ncbi:hypothetical protein AVEN_193122-1 [Araneus ventricosus]|uniref:Uncharacterized protein n=1 Tax=Araneus ventricosus TaxID=182803 RepID=A0A4Y2AZY6_ARAVE|nr:hypothetical protein AVEN_193122-1 [Araneus ventricosus]
MRRGRGGLVIRSRPWGRKVPGSKLDSTEDPPCMGLGGLGTGLICRSALLRFQIKVGSSETSSRWSGVEVRRGVPAQVSSSSARGSKLRGPSQNSPLAASKRDVTITKLNLTKHQSSPENILN